MAFGSYITVIVHISTVIDRESAKGELEKQQEAKRWMGKGKYTMDHLETQVIKLCV